MAADERIQQFPYRKTGRGQLVPRKGALIRGSLPIIRGTSNTLAMPQPKQAKVPRAYPVMAS